jgi:uncharacterized membrane-anchored protein YitT (DUF2179 family)
MYLYVHIYVYIFVHMNVPIFIYGYRYIIMHITLNYFRSHALFTSFPLLERGGVHTVANDRLRNDNSTTW